ncbi:MAG: bifunctional YncE family protein/alkaline phosphatase family protein [Acidobacteriaceae bacterium]
MLTNRMPLLVAAVFLVVGAVCPAQTTPINLPSSKQILAPVPGHPQPLNSLPMAMAVSPDGRYIAIVNAGYGTFESRYMQSIAVVDTAIGKLADFPDDRTGHNAQQTLYSGLAFSADGKHLYAGMGSLTAPEGRPLDGGGGRASSRIATGNAIAVYSFNAGTLAPERTIPVPLQALARGKTTTIPSGEGDSSAVPFPAAIAVVPSAGRSDGDRLLVANNLSDNAVLLDASTGKVLQSFDLSSGKVVPSTYPIAAVAAKDGVRAYVALWNSSEVAELDLSKGTVVRRLPLLKPSSPIAPGSHPSALLLSPDGDTLYVALTNSDAVAAVNVSGGRFKVRTYFSARLPGQTYFGAEPQALALSPDASRLYVANGGSDAVAVYNTASTKTTPAGGSFGVSKERARMVPPLGFIPTEWFPTALSLAHGKLYIATAKGKGTGPNNMPQRMLPDGTTPKIATPRTYISMLLHGSLATLDTAGIERELPKLTRDVLVSNRMRAAQEKMRFAHAASPNGASPIRHVIYVIKENRTYDQIFGDLNADGKPVGNGDPSLTMYGAAITPNQHRLSLQFGVLDNFYDSAEVSADGHVWSTAAITSDYNEKTWQQDYRGRQRTYDYEGVVANGSPLLEGIPDVDEPASSYLWTDLAAHGKSLYHFGEFISSTFCNEGGPLLPTQSKPTQNKTTQGKPLDKPQSNPQMGTPELEASGCPRSFIRLGEPIPEAYGGGTSKYPWRIPLLASNTATKPELVGRFAPEYPDFNLSFPDQLRVEVFLRHLRAWEADRARGHDTMPQFVMLRLPNDHTAGTGAGMPTPQASIADNDLAIGRAVEAISHSAYWSDTAFFILEDDAQNGADHVDAHRSLALVISKYSPRNETPLVDSRFYTTVSMLRTMENLLGIPPMNNNDAFAPLISTVFTGAGDQPAFTADYSNRDNGLIYAANRKSAPGAKESSRMDFRHEDRVDPQKLNAILWRDAMGSKPLPAQLRQKQRSKKHDDDDD